MRLSTRLLALCLAVALLASCAGPVAHRRSWVIAETEHFEIVSVMGARRTADLAEMLETFRYFAGVLLASTDRKIRVPTRIYALDLGTWSELVGRRDYEGIFRQGMRENHVLLRGDTWDSERILFHEYVHFLMADDLVAYPLWYAEGFAELLSTIERSRKGWTFGGASKRIPSLRKGIDTRWTVSVRDLRGLSSAEVSSFYAQSWALVRYLLRERPHGNRRTARELVDYLARVERGDAWDTSFEEAFDVDFGEVDKSIHRLIYRRRFDAWRLPAELLPEPATAKVAPLEGPELTEELGWLAIVLGRYQHAETYFRHGLETAPQRSRSLIGLGDALKFQDRYDEAAPHYERGLALADDDALNHLDYAEYLYDRARREPDASDRADLVAKARAHLVRSWKLDDSNPETYAIYGMSYLEEQDDPVRAVEMLEHAHGLLPGEQQIRLLLARAYAKVGRGEEAIRLLERTRAHAGWSDQVRELITRIRAETAEAAEWAEPAPDAPALVPDEERPEP